MREYSAPVCFHCGQTIETPEEGPRLNRLSDGRSCPVCADRLLEMLPSLVRDVAREIAEVESEPEGSTYEEDSSLPDEPA